MVPLSFSPNPKEKSTLTRIYLEHLIWEAQKKTPEKKAGWRLTHWSLPYNTLVSRNRSYFTEEEWQTICTGNCPVYSLFSLLYFGTLNTEKTNVVKININVTCTFKWFCFVSTRVSRFKIAHFRIGLATSGRNFTYEPEAVKKLDVTCTIKNSFWSRKARSEQFSDMTICLPRNQRVLLPTTTNTSTSTSKWTRCLDNFNSFDNSTNVLTLVSVVKNNFKARRPTMSYQKELLLSWSTAEPHTLFLWFNRLEYSLNCKVSCKKPLSASFHIWAKCRGLWDRRQLKSL